MSTLQGFSIDPPPGLTVQELQFGADGTALSLVVQSRSVPEGTTAESMAASILAQLQQHPVISNPRQSEMAFSDGGKGVVVSCVVQSEGGSVRQYLVLRVHGGRACTAALTAPADSGQETAMAMMKCLASLRPD